MFTWWVLIMGVGLGVTVIALIILAAYCEWNDIRWKGYGRG